MKNCKDSRIGAGLGVGLGLGQGFGLELGIGRWKRWGRVPTWGLPRILLTQAGVPMWGGGNPVQGSFYAEHVQNVSVWPFSDTTWAAASV